MLTKIALLTKNNLRQQFHHIRWLAFQFLIPILLVLLLIFARIKYRIKRIDEKTFAPNNLEGILEYYDGRNLTFNLAFSPSNEILKDILLDGAKKEEENTKVILTFHNLPKSHPMIYGYENADALETALENDLYFAGIEFEDSYAGITELPDKIHFTLRFPSELRTQPNHATWQTDSLENIVGAFRGVTRFPDEDIYLHELFLYIQWFVSKAVMKHSKQVPNVAICRFPEAANINNFTANGVYLALTIYGGYLLTAVYMQLSIIHDVEGGTLIQTKLLGIDVWMHWFAKFVTSYIICFGISLFLVVLFKFNYRSDLAVLNYINTKLLLTFLMILSAAMLCYASVTVSFFRTKVLFKLICITIWLLPVALLLFNHSFHKNHNFWVRILLSLQPTLALLYGCDWISDYEENYSRCDWDDIFNYASMNGNYTFFSVLMMMIISCIFYICLTLYLEDFIKKTIWHRIRHIYKTRLFNWNRNSMQSRAKIFSYFSKPGQLLTVSLDQVTFKPFKNISMVAYKNEITVLLGNNTKSHILLAYIMAGLVTPSSGNVMILDAEIETKFKYLRKHIGIYVPDMFSYENLTVREHIRLYSYLRNLTYHQVDGDVEKYISLLDLSKFADKKLLKLSDDIRLKVLISCAMCGNTSIIILAEPFTKASPAIVHDIMEFLTSEKYDRTIIVFTKLSYVVEAIGDRAGIIFNDNLVCYGETYHLRDTLGSGYNVVCVKMENFQTDDVIRIFKKYLPYSAAETDTPIELTYNIPNDYFHVMAELLRNLEENVQPLRIKAVKVYYASLHEVYLNATDESQKRYNLQRMKSIYPIAEHTAIPLNFNQHHAVQKGKSTFCKQFYAMFYKNVLYTSNHICTHILLSVVMITFMLILYFIPFRMIEPLVPMTFSLTQYPEAFILLESKDVTDASQLEFLNLYIDYVSSFGDRYHFEITESLPIHKYILRLCDKKYEAVKKLYIAGLTVHNDGIICWFNGDYIHSAPLSLGLALTAYQREAGGSNKEIIVTNSPQKYEMESLVQYYKTRVSQPILVLIVMVFVCLISISSVSFVTYERTTYAKLIQFINGLHFWIYWVSHLIWQLIFFLLIPIVVVAVVICIFSTKSDYFSDMADLFVIIICVAIYMLPFLYFCTFHIQEQHMVPALIIAAFIMGILDMYFTTFRNHLSFILSIVPFYAVLSAIEDYHVHKKVQEACTNITIENCNGTTNCCYSKYSWGTSGRLDELAFMLFFGVFFFNWVVLTDSGFMNEVLHWVRDVHSEYNINKVAPDESVEDEITRVDNMTDADMQQQTIVVNHVTKVEQDQKFVVNDVTFAIEKEESFGVVGLYGSGKNALLNVIAGVTPPTVGVVRINNKNMNAFFIKEIYSDIDYLARKNALFEEFTGYQNLKLHFLINGIKNINDVCEILLGSFYLTDVASTKVKHYTTMNKYMLRMAVGCIRRKSIVLMDNPISNTDPPTTIMLWRLINIMRSTGMTILLTTNSMTDCNMCCTRFAILSGGEMKFIGTKEELLERSEDGYILEIIVNNDRSSDVSIISSEESIKKMELNDFMQSRFQNPKLILICFPRFKFFIPRRNKLWKTFKLMEKHKTELSIVSYFVTEKDFQTILVEFSR